MSGARWGTVMLAVGAAVVVLAAAASADDQLTLSISKPQFEGAPVTFSADGVADPAIDGESADFLTGVVMRHGRSCPPGGSDDWGNVAGSLLPTLDAFPIGPFHASYRMSPTGVNHDFLIAGTWRECAYLQDRITYAVKAAAQENFTVRRPRVGLRIVRMPKHERFVLDTQGRPNTWPVPTIAVRARSQLSLRTVQIGVEAVGVRRPCTADLNSAHAGESDPYRVKAGGTHSHRIKTPMIFPAGQPPYGKRVRVCAVLAFADPGGEGTVLEASQARMLRIRR